MSFSKSTNLSTDTDSASASATPMGLQSGSYRKKTKKLQNDAMMKSAMKILSTPVDSFQIFGDFVADQMRGMNENKRKRLKLIIQKAIIELEEEPDETIMEPLDNTLGTITEMPFDSST